MKNKTDRKLLTALILSCALYALIVLDSAMGSVMDEFIPNWYSWGIGLVASFHAVPAFCAQLLLCRNGKRRWVRLLPLAILLALTALLGIAAAVATGWDVLGWLLLMCLLPAPAVGCIAAWIAWTVQRKKSVS